MHKKVHLATYPEFDFRTIGNLDLFIEWARDEEIVAPVTPARRPATRMLSYDEFGNLDTMIGMVGR